MDGIIKEKEQGNMKKIVITVSMAALFFLLFAVTAVRKSPLTLGFFTLMVSSILMLVWELIMMLKPHKKTEGRAPAMPEMEPLSKEEECPIPVPETPNEQKPEKEEEGRKLPEEDPIRVKLCEWVEENIDAVVRNQMQRTDLVLEIPAELQQAAQDYFLSKEEIENVQTYKEGEKSFIRLFFM